MDYSAGNRRLVKNTIFNYIQLPVSIIIGLITSRIVLQILGVSDYGLFSIVGGVLGMFTFFASSLSAATTRFINFEMGKPDGDLNKVFNTCLTLHVLFAIGFIIIAEVGGIWYIDNYLNVEPGKEADAMFIYQVTLAVFCIGLVNIPYQSLLTAFEKFGLIAIINITNMLLKLGLVYLLFIFRGNLLRTYALLMASVTLVSFIVYHVLAYRYWPDVVRHRFIRRNPMYKDILVFNNYNLLHTVAMMARDTGSNLLINFFFGTAVNGVYSISKTIQTSVNSLIVNIDSASGPQITQSYSSGDMNRCNALVENISRISIVIATAASFILFTELPAILELWLKDVPEGTLIFSQLMLLLVVVSSTSCGLTLMINASGKIKWFRIVTSLLFILCLPVGYLLFKIGFPAYWIVLLFILVDVVWRIFQLLMMKTIINFDVKNYLKSAYPRVLMTMAILAGYLVLYRLAGPAGIWKIPAFLTTALFSGSVAIFVGLKKTEREKIADMVREKIRKR